ncbi:MAG TPA: DUF2490 domain-containing protein [Bacteroidia bacterium]|jgi:hypothetical protein|nr:DUF2490 domain-containing protein [Bacteroidia bacterium]
MNHSVYKNKITCFCLLFLLVTSKTFSQIGAEAQGGRASLWAAFGIDQKISERWLSVTDIGYGRHSDPNNNTFLKRQGLNVLTQDFIYKANKHWSFSVSMGYWRRNFYDDNIPYNVRNYPQQFRNEIRPYQKTYYHHAIKNIKVTHVLRTDYRFYYDQTFNHRWATPFEFRARYLQSWKIPLTKNKKNFIIPIDEVLTAIDKYSATVAQQKNSRWSPYQFTENRLSLYYRRSLFNQKIDIDLGIMCQYWRDKPGISTFNTSYNIMFDIIIKEPFTWKKDKEVAPQN